MSALVLGVAGSLHCAGMCGPLALALPRADGLSRRKLVFGRLLYNVGRAMTYAALGAVFGGIGHSLNLAGLQRAVSILCGVLLLLYASGALLPAVPRGLSVWITRAMTPLQQIMVSRLRSGSLGNLFVIGMINGLLPCGLVYIALAGAVATGTSWHGALFMFLFGLGTAPLIFALGLAGPSLHARLRGRFRAVLPATIALLGVWFVLRGSNLGIPLLSPGQAPNHSSPSCCSGHLVR
ncbi:MAG: sulfite exporter TauE/SafE family protein [Kiritimatiellae bacterium]|nr:sulfite exporter TauE/SafE family protein [Kiritimatiellia bacterium]MDW8458328.1 sulfite exporter TauE/SafE family protein [Verrucomicrobiota bacterium]